MTQSSILRQIFKEANGTSISLSSKSRLEDIRKQRQLNKKDSKRNLSEKLKKKKIVSNHKRQNTAYPL